MERHDDFNFVIFTQAGDIPPGRYNIAVCSTDVPVDWQQGERMKWIKFVQQKDCKANMRYTAYTDEHGNRIKYPVVAKAAIGEGR